MIGFGVTEGLQDRVGLQQFVFDCLQIRLLARRGGDELQHFFRGLITKSLSFEFSTKFRTMSTLIKKF